MVYHFGIVRNDLVCMRFLWPAVTITMKTTSLRITTCALILATTAWAAEEPNGTLPGLRRIGLDRRSIVRNRLSDN